MIGKRLGLEGKVVAVTGANRGIGKSIALAFAQEGADVAIGDLRITDEVGNVISGLGRKYVCKRMDVSKKNEVMEFVNFVKEELGKIDIMVNNAGVRLFAGYPSEDLPEEKWRRVLDVDLSGVLFGCQEAAKAMIGRGGNIINIASISGANAYPMRVAYCTAKAGVIHLTKVLAVEWARYNIRVNAIAPGFVETDMVLNAIKSGLLHKKEVEKRIPLHRLGRPKEIAAAAVFLASDEASYITGETLFVDGGYNAYGDGAAMKKWADLMESEGKVG